MEKKRIVVGVTGASGSVYAINFLKALKKYPNIEVHAVFSAWAIENIRCETELTLKEVNELADFTYSNKALGAKIASGSFLTDGMVIVPASMKTVAGITYGLSDNLIARAADVTMKEKRKLIVVPRETPLSTLHLENLTKLSQLGAHIIPPMPAFYNQPKTIQDLLDHHTTKLLDALGIVNDYDKRWEG